MVVLAAAICTRHGKPLVSRQFVDLSRVRVEGLLASFPKLVESEKQHTFVETDSIRYVYQPLENLYLLVLTNKSSNILEDLETLHLLTKLVPEYCRSLDEDEVTRCAFDLLFAFDEVISTGYREKSTVAQIKSYTGMESQEEKFHEMMEKTKRREAMEIAKRKQYEIEQARAEGIVTGQDRPMYGAQSIVAANSSSSSSSSSSSLAAAPSPALSSTGPAPAAYEAPRPRGGMVLDAQRDSFEATLKRDGISIPVSRPAAPAATTPAPSSSSPSAAASTVPKKTVHLALNEVFAATVSREGVVNSLNITGDLSLLIADAGCAHLAIKLANFAEAKSRGFVFEAHPNINKAAFEQGIIGHRDAARPLPVGSAFRVFKWRLPRSPATDESMLPLRLTCWPSPTGDGRTVVTLEFELSVPSLVIENLVVAIPLPPGASPVVDEIEGGGSSQFDPRANLLTWSMPLVERATSNAGRLEFTMASLNQDALFPIRIAFRSSTPLCPVHPQAVVTTKDSQPLDFSCERQLVVDQFTIE